jgi:hypothetical protein
MELISQPSLTSSPEICILRLRCRVQPGLALSVILRKFQQSRIYFRGDEPNYYISHLLPVDALQRINSGDAFSRIIEVVVSAPASKISVKIEGTDGQRRHISRSPYPVGQLIRHQGLDCLFGKSNHRDVYDSSMIQDDKVTMRLRTESLQKTLKSVVAREII